MYPCKNLDYTENYIDCKIIELEGFSCPVKYWERGAIWTEGKGNEGNPKKVQFYAIEMLKDPGYGDIRTCKERVNEYLKSKKIKFKNVSAKNIYFNSGLYLVQIKKDGTHKIIQVGK